jgi:uncharacterized protein
MSIATLERIYRIVNIPPRSDNRILRLNVGFLLKESAGFTREFAFDHAASLVIEEVPVLSLQGLLRLTRARQGIVVQGLLHSQTEATCTRCLTSFHFPFDVEISDLFVYPATPEQVENPFLFTYVDEGGFIDLTPILREEGILSMPIQALCRSDCKGLCPECGQNRNEMNCTCEPETGDPRLSILRDMFEKK